MRLHSLQVLLPTHMLPVNVAHVGHKESIFFPSEAHIGIYTSHARFQCFLDSVFGSSRTMVMMLSLHRSVFHIRKVIVKGQRFVLNCGRSGCWCHNHTEDLDVNSFVGSPGVLLRRSKKIRPEGDFTRPSRPFLLKRKNL